MIATVTHPLVADDRDASTVWIAVYWARSDSVPGRRYKVTHDHRLQLWRCECMAYGPCKHLTRVKRHECARWWRRTLADYTAPMLRSMIADREAIVRVGLGDMDDDAALDAAYALLAVVRAQDEAQRPAGVA